MTNVHVVDNRSPGSMNGGLHALVLSRTIRIKLIVLDSDFVYRKVNDLQAKQ